MPPSLIFETQKGAKEALSAGYFCSNRCVGLIFFQSRQLCSHWIDELELGPTLLYSSH